MYKGRVESENQSYILNFIEKQQEFIAGRKLSEDIINLTKSKAERLLTEAREQAIIESDERKREAHAEGYANGYNEGMEKAEKEKEIYRLEILEQKDRFEKYFKSLFESYRKAKEDIYKKLEKEIVQIIVTSTEQILKEKIDDNPSIILKAIKNAALSIERAQRITIRINPEDYEEYGKDYFTNSMSLPDVNIVADENVEKHGFIIESEDGLIDGQLSTQIEYVKSLLSDSTA